MSSPPLSNILALNDILREAGYSRQIAAAEAFIDPKFKNELGLELYVLHREETNQKVERNCPSPCARAHTHEHVLFMCVHTSRKVHEEFPLWLSRKESD